MRRDAESRTRRRLLAGLLPLLLLGAAAAPAQAAIEPPVTIEGPTRDIVGFGGAALAPDGSGGVAYLRVVDGIPHVFASRCVRGRWSAPIRVDRDRRYEARSPRIAAGRGGALLVVWVTQMATVRGQVQYGLVSASLGPGASGFGPSLIVDSNVGNGLGTDPSLSGVAAGQAAVAYRVVTNDFSGSTTAVQLRPGDVMADVRVARFAGVRWSRVGAVNRSASISMRQPTAANGPRVVTSPDGGAVVAWQEPDQGGVARIWARRLFGSTPGPPLQASPSTWGRRPLAEDADAFALDVTPRLGAKVAMRVSGGADSTLGGTRVLLNTLPIRDDDQGRAFAGAVLADGAPTSDVGAPSVSAADDGQSGRVLLGFGAAGAARLVVGDDAGLAPARELGPAAGQEVVTAIGPDGGGIVGWPALDAAGRAGVALRQDFPAGGTQTAFVTGGHAGTVEDLAVGPAGSGDAVVAFLQGRAGRWAIVAARVSVPPAPFGVGTPAGWVRPRQARITWDAAASAVPGAVRYAVVLDGRVVADGLRRRAYRPAPALLGNGVRKVRVIARDAQGQQLLSPSIDLRVDARAPGASAAARRGTRTVVVRVRDGESGVASAICSFGDGGTRARGTRSFRHEYARAGIYTLRVAARDRLGNRAVRTLKVHVG